VAAGVAWLTGPPAIQPLWWVLGTLGVLLAAIDARTTWLPLPLTRLAWAAMIAAGVVAYALGAGWPTLLRAAAGAALALLLYLAVWLASRGGFGFGDVRFAPLVGAPAAAHSWSLLIWALLLGSVAGAVWGVVRMVRGRQGPYPYAPWLLAGGYLACATVWAG
jgi:leader peptidase (prepilin peptidase)/N-methyltransferase